MSSRFRASTMLARKLEELGVSPVAVLRQAGLPPVEKWGRSCIVVFPLAGDVRGVAESAAV
jgi:hypothetical protein